MRVEIVQPACAILADIDDAVVGDDRDRNVLNFVLFAVNLIQEDARGVLQRFQLGAAARIGRVHRVRDIQHQSELDPTQKLRGIGLSMDRHRLAADNAHEGGRYLDRGLDPQPAFFLVVSNPELRQLPTEILARIIGMKELARILSPVLRFRADKLSPSQGGRIDGCLQPALRRVADAGIDGNAESQGYRYDRETEKHRNAAAVMLKKR